MFHLIAKTNKQSDAFHDHSAGEIKVLEKEV